MFEDGIVVLSGAENGTFGGNLIVLRLEDWLEAGTRSQFGQGRSRSLYISVSWDNLTLPGGLPVIAIVPWQRRRSTVSGNSSSSDVVKGGTSERELTDLRQSD